jgi:hypothetical protein
MTFAHLPLPRPAIAWKPPWRQVETAAEQHGLQRELLAELSAAHPLWGCDPVVFGRHESADDVLVALKDGRFAIVHLVWHGHVDQFPAEFPGTLFYADLAELLAALEADERA